MNLERCEAARAHETKFIVSSACGLVTALDVRAQVGTHRVKIVEVAAADAGLISGLARTETSGSLFGNLIWTIFGGADAINRICQTFSGIECLLLVPAAKKPGTRGTASHTVAKSLMSSRTMEQRQRGGSSRNLEWPGLSMCATSADL